MAIQQPTIHILRNPVLPWGDYGNVLYCGMTSHLGRINGLLQLERTGPFVPPISLSGIGNVIVTDKFRRDIQASGLTGVTFKSVIKKHIVLLEWEKWDKRSGEPLEIPETGEPENYILGRMHSEALAYEIGDIWELCIEKGALVEKQPVGKNSWDVEIYLLESSIPNKDFFRAEGVGSVYLSKHARLWLERTYYEYVDFRKINLR